MGTDLQKEGSQNPECVWNDGTRYLVFQKKKSKRDDDMMSNDMQMLEEVQSNSPTTVVEENETNTKGAKLEIISTNYRQHQSSKIEGSLNETDLIDDFLTHCDND